MGLLFEDKPLVINPKLAELIGLNEAIIIQQMNYWLKRSEHFIDGKCWVYNSVPQWKKQFPFFSESTIKRAIYKLEELGLLFTGNYNKDGRDKTKWYSINYDALNELVNDASCQNGRCIDQIEPMQQPKLTRPLPETTTETTTDIKDLDKSKSTKPKKRKTSLPSDFNFPDEWIDIAKDIRPDLSRLDIAYQANKFIDYWVSKGDTRASWVATWRNWVRSEWVKPQGQDIKKQTIDFDDTSWIDGVGGLL